MWACNRFNTDYYTTICTPDYPLLKADMAAARALGTDLIAVITHWGIEYQYQENHHQRELAEFLVAQGADLVLGGHPHVLQPYGTITARGVDGAEKTGFVCYSLGNLISNQLELDTMTTVILDLELTRDPKTEKTTLTNVSYTPYFMVHRDTAPVGERRFLANTHEALAQPESFTAGERRRLEESLALVHQILGPEGDPLAS